MFTQEEKHQTAKTFAEMLDTIDRVLGSKDDIVELTSDKVHPNDWDAIVEREDDIAALLEIFKVMIITASQVIDNDALVSHTQAAITYS